MHFEKLTYDNVKSLLPFLYKYYYGLCDYAPMVLLLWSGFFDYHFAIAGDALFLRQTRNGKHEYMMPIAEDAKDALKVLCNWVESTGDVLRLVAVPEKFVSIVQEVLGVELAECDLSEFDYVYLTKDLSELKGRKYNGQRNHINRFVRDNPDAIFRKLVPSDKSALLRFLEQYHLNDQSETYLYDVKAVKTFVERFEQFDFLGGAIFCGDQIIAFAFGDAIGDTLFVHVEKALRNFSGVGEMINREFVRLFAVEALFVNREEDMGDLGMRKSKLSYYPQMRKKYKTKN